MIKDIKLKATAMDALTKDITIKHPLVSCGRNLSKLHANFISDGVTARLPARRIIVLRTANRQFLADGRGPSRDAIHPAAARIATLRGCRPHLPLRLVARPAHSARAPAARIRHPRIIHGVGAA